MALEYGHAMHEVFAAIRLWQLATRQELPGHARVKAHKLFEPARWDAAWKSSMTQSDTERDELMVLAYDIIHSSGFKDDPGDQIRTLNSMELAAIQYIDSTMKYMDNWEIYVKDKDDPQSYVGIENVFDVILTYDDEKQYRFIGTLDALTLDKGRNSRPTLEDNKTAARLDDGWKAAFILSHQVSGYLACASALLGLDIRNARILGLKNKPTGKGEDYWTVSTSRTAEEFHRWAFWFRHTADQYEFYKDHYEYAPRYTHSCNRYFRPCSLISFCGDTFEGRLEQWDQMIPAALSPSELGVED
jgi:hypothetical protein